VGGYLTPHNTRNYVICILCNSNDDYVRHMHFIVSWILGANIYVYWAVILPLIFHIYHNFCIHLLFFSLIGDIHNKNKDSRVPRLSDTRYLANGTKGK